MSPTSRSPGWSAADERLLGEVRQVLGGTHELVGAVGRDRHGLPALVAREVASGELVVLLLDRAQDSEGEAAELTLVERRTLDESVPAPGVPCPSCRAPQQAWSHGCAVCGSEVDGATYARGLDPAQLLGMVQRATAAEMDVIGTIHHSASGDEAGAPVYFARERSTHELVALRLAGRSTDDAGQSDIALGVIALPALALPESVGATSDAASDAPRPTMRATPPPGVATVSLLREALEAAAAPAPAEARVCPQCGAEYPAGVRFCARDGAALRARNAGSDLTSQIVAEKYLVMGKLGVGGMGEVYLAKHVHMGRECALKIMRRELTDDVDAAGRFRREAASASRVNHPNIATIYDFGETSEGIAYIVMEYVDGEPLSAILAREGKLEPARAVAIARQIADALGAAHDLGIVHRDLKPDNVMIARSHDSERVKVVDFGIAKAMQAGSRQLTRTGYVLGTPAYMSPEQILGEELDGRSDQYNLACILYEMLTGKATFAGPTGEIVIHRRLTEPPPHPRKMNPAVPRALDEVVAHALARTAAERFANAAEFGAAMAEAIERRDSRWSPLAWLGRGKEKSASTSAAPTTAPGDSGSRAAGTPPAAAPDAAGGTTGSASSSTGIMVPRVRPPTGAESASGITRIAPAPEPPTSPPIARPKWPAGGSAGFDRAGTSGERVSVPAGTSGEASAREPWAGAAVTGERTGEHSGERRLEPDAAGESASASRQARAATSTAPVARPARSRVRLAVAGGILAIGTAGAVVWVAQRPPAPDGRTASTTDGAAERGGVGGAAGAAGIAAESATADSVGASPAIGANAKPPVAGAGRDGASAMPADDRAGSALAAELDAQITRQTTLAKAARTRAVAAGARASALAEGDSLLKSALSLRERGDFTNALRDGIGAAESWTLAERAAEAARETASRSSSAAGVTPAAPPSETSAASSRITDRARPVAPENAPSVPPTTGAGVGAAANEAAAASGALRDYVDALSRRDLAAMRRLWPTMPANTADGFQNLFKAATKFSASLSEDPAAQVSGTAADAELRYSLDYFLPSQGAMKPSFRLHAVMRRDGDRWTIRSLEPVR